MRDLELHGSTQIEIALPANERRMNRSVGCDPSVSAPFVHAVEAQGGAFKRLGKPLAEVFDNSFEPSTQGCRIRISEPCFHSVTDEWLEHGVADIGE